MTCSRSAGMPRARTCRPVKWLIASTVSARSSTHLSRDRITGQFAGLVISSP